MIEHKQTYAKLFVHLSLSCFDVTICWSGQSSWPDQLHNSFFLNPLDMLVVKFSMQSSYTTILISFEVDIYCQIQHAVLFVSTHNSLARCLRTCQIWFITLKVVSVWLFNESTWLLCIDNAHANFSGSCFLVSKAPVAVLTVQISWVMTLCMPDVNLTAGAPEQKKKEKLAKFQHCTCVCLQPLCSWMKSKTTPRAPLTKPLCMSRFLVSIICNYNHSELFIR